MTMGLPLGLPPPGVSVAFPPGLPPETVPLLQALRLNIPARAAKRRPRGPKTLGDRHAQASCIGIAPV
jgi:hypothetical protein